MSLKAFTLGLGLALQPQSPVIESPLCRWEHQVEARRFVNTCTGEVRKIHTPPRPQENVA